MKILLKHSRWCPLALLLVGCGGGGGGSSSSGGSNSLSLTFDIRSIGGTLVDNETASSTPQTVRINVDGTVQTINNVIVPENLASGWTVVLVKEGSQVLNMNIPNPGTGITFSGSAIHAPINSSGVLQASLITSGGATFSTPPGTWHQHQLPNGLFVFVATEAEVQAKLNAAVKIPNDIGNLAGTGNFTYTSPLNSTTTRVGFEAGDLTHIDVNDQGNITGVAGNNATIAVPWHSQRFVAGSGNLIFTNASIEVSSSN